MYRDGRPSLISGGTLPAESRFADVTPDGSDVFFTTDDQLSGRDRDTNVDLYDARVGGTAESAAPQLSSCAGSECREPANGPVAAASSPSQRIRQEPFRPAPSGKAKLSVVSSSLSAKALRLVVQVSERGRIRVSGARVRTVTRNADKAGRYTLIVGLSAKSRAAHKAHRKVKVAVKVALTPPFGLPASAKLSRTLGN
jgi:hypothetical protein